MITNKDYYTKKGQISIRETPHKRGKFDYELLLHYSKKKFKNSIFINKKTGEKQEGIKVKMPIKVLFTCRAEYLEEAKPIIEDWLNSPYEG